MWNRIGSENKIEVAITGATQFFEYNVFWKEAYTFTDNMNSEILWIKGIYFITLTII